MDILRNWPGLKITMKEKFKRIPRNYDGNRPTGREIKDLLPQLAQHLFKGMDQKRDPIFNKWKELMGEKLAPMAVPVDFKNQTLYVQVKNSSLYSILKNQQKEMLLKKLKESLPTIPIENIVFHIGV